MATTANLAVEFERTNFRALLSTNPNYFGNLKTSRFKVVKALSLSTTYEELVCVGFHPQINQLEAVVRIKRNSGYSGGLCAGGSQEYVRFYTSADGGTTWTDQGLAQFTAYDVTHPKPLDQAVTQIASPKRTFCSVENVIKVRAILSWNSPPPPNNPNYHPVWGNVVNASILVEPRRFFSIKDLAELDVKLPKDLPFELPSVQLQIPIPDPLPPIALQRLYAKEKVPEARYLYKAISEFALASPHTMQLLTKDVDQYAILPDAKIDWTKVIKALQSVGDGNQDFEELTCVGYDPTNDALVGVIQVKKSNGYSGKQCSGGSREYVGWWLDWGDGAGWTYSGTTSVRVYDTTRMPTGGLNYAVFEPINTVSKRKNCGQGPVIPKIRAILSWEVAPSTTDPNWAPTWGSCVESTAILTPGALSDLHPILESVGSVAACAIDQATGKTYAPANQPFGAVIPITGFIPNAPDISVPTSDRMKYRIQVRELPGGAWQTVSNSFGIWVTERVGSALPTQYTINQSVDSDGYYTYQEDMNVAGAGWRLVQGRILGYWITAKPMHGLYQIKINAKDPVTNTLFAAQTILCSNGTTRSSVNVYLDEDPPECTLTLTGFSRGGGPVQAAAPCGTFQVGDVLHGTFSVSDEHFGSLSLYVEPAAQANGTTPSPSSRSYPVVPTSGESGSWTLDTRVMEACGYVLRLDVSDRTIEGSGGWDNHVTIGFCLKRP